MDVMTGIFIFVVILIALVLGYMALQSNSDKNRSATQQWIRQRELDASRDLRNLFYESLQSYRENGMPESRIAQLECDWLEKHDPKYVVPTSHILTLPGLVLTYQVVDVLRIASIENQITRILLANPHIDLMTYESQLDIKILRIDKSTPPHKPIKGFNG